MSAVQFHFQNGRPPKRQTIHTPCHTRRGEQGFYISQATSLLDNQPAQSSPHCQIKNQKKKLRTRRRFAILHTANFGALSVRTEARGDVLSTFSFAGLSEDAVHRPVEAAGSWLRRSFSRRSRSSRCLRPSFCSSMVRSHGAIFAAWHPRRRNPTCVPRTQTQSFSWRQRVTKSADKAGCQAWVAQRLVRRQEKTSAASDAYRIRRATSSSLLLSALDRTVCDS